MNEFGEACSHGIKWACHCRECDLVSARDLVSHWGEAVDAARRLIAAAPINQCDGCQIDAPLSPRGNHQMPDGGFMGCTKDRYVEHFEREGRAQKQEVSQ